MQQRADILLVGLTPPPFHGQSIATGLLFDHDWSPLRIARLPIRYSNKIDEIGRPSLKKVGHMFSLVWQCWRLRFRTGAKVMYYTPTSASLIPFVRDVVFLLMCRLLFKRVILHYHAGGLPDFLRSNFFSQLLGRFMYGRGAWSIALTPFVEVPGQYFGVAKEFIVPNGVDVPKEVVNYHRDNKEVTYFLFVGNFELRELAASISCKVDFLGICSGDAKWKHFTSADVFIFPSYYASENQPLVILEAMASGLPVLATRWRGIPGQVEDNKTGILVDTKDVEGLAEAAGKLARDFELRTQLGKAGCERYLREFTTEAHLNNMRAVFDTALKDF